MNFDPEGKDNLILKNSEIISRYIRAGKGELVLRSPSGTAHKYAFLEPKDVKSFPEGTIFVYIYHNDKRYYLGMLDKNKDTLSLRRTTRSCFNEDTDAVRGARFIFKMANDQALVNRTPMTLYQSGRCCKCGRPLELEETLAGGIGKRCLAKYNILQDKEPWDGNTATY